jgi:hypothetical protein
MRRQTGQLSHPEMQVDPGLPMTEVLNNWVVFKIPAPPSANNPFRNAPGRERVRATRYKEWQSEAGRLIKEKLGPLPRAKGDVLADLDLPSGVDLDDIYAIAGLLRKLELIEHDRYMVDLHIRRVGPRPCIVRLRPVGKWG